MMSNHAQWLFDLGKAENDSNVDGLVPVKGYKRDGRPPEEVVMMERAKDYGAHAVFFEAGSQGRPPMAQAFVFVSDHPDDEPQFADKYRQLWSWGGVPLIYLKTPGLVQLFRCAHQADFYYDSGELKCNPIDILKRGVNISNAPWWNDEQIRDGTLWNDTKVCRELLSAEKSAHKSLIDEVKSLYEDLNDKGILSPRLRRKLLILSLLIAYLEERKVFEDDYLERFLPGASKFFHVLSNGEALVSLLDALEKRFNGNIFSLDDVDRESIRDSKELALFAEFVEGRKERSGQLNFWQRYSFKDLPVELISHVYQLFVKDTNSSVYTPPFLVRLMLEESLSWERLDRLLQHGEIILDPCCGSGVFLVEAYKRLVIHWRSRNKWKKPSENDLKELIEKVHGIDLEAGAVELAAFSLCLALCDALEPLTIRASIKLFPVLEGKTLHHSCFFKAKEQGLVKEPIGAMVGNPPFTSSLKTAGAKRSYMRYQANYDSLPDKQLAYLFLHEAMEMVAKGGVLCMLQQYNFLYNHQSLDFRRNFFVSWNVREILDFISVEGLFKKAGVKTKIVVVVAEASKPPENQKILHATFRQSGRTYAERGFDIDYYDLHWLPRQLLLNKDHIWRSNLLGGGRVLGFVDRLKDLPTLEEYAKAQKWDFGEGFIRGSQGERSEHIGGKPFLPSESLTENGIDRDAITIAPDEPIERPRTDKRFSPPLLLIREQMNLYNSLWEESYLTYTNQIVGFAAPRSHNKRLKQLSEWLETNATVLRAFVAATSVKLFTQKATTLSSVDILTLPYATDTLGISLNEKILVEDIVGYYRDLILRGDRSDALSESGFSALPNFTGVFSRQINAIYKKNPLHALEPQSWPGFICQPFAFGKGEADWSGADELKGKLDNFLRERKGDTLQITRIARIYDGNFVFLLKPDRLRYWLRSVALRDADETLADLRAQGF